MPINYNNVSFLRLGIESQYPNPNLFIRISVNNSYALLKIFKYEQKTLDDCVRELFYKLCILQAHINSLENGLRNFR